MQTFYISLWHLGQPTAC